MKTIKIILAGLLLSLSYSAFAEENALTFTEVMYQEASPGVGSYPYRILVNDEFIRFDGGADEESYILFDRKQKKVISVNHEDKTRFILQPTQQALEQADPIKTKLTVSTQHTELAAAPKIQGINAKMHEITANEIICRQVLSFEGLHLEVTEAWAEYEEVMQMQNLITLKHTPQEMQTSCFITNNITNASEYLKYGLPFSIKSKDGSVRILQNFTTVKKPKIMVTPPKKYREFTL